MSDTIDLDEEFESEAPEEEPDGNYGDWLWKDGDPDDEPEPAYVGWPDDGAGEADTATADTEGAVEATPSAGGSEESSAGTAEAPSAPDVVDEEDAPSAPDEGDVPDATDESADAEAGTAMPGIPRESGPVGVPQSKGGAGGGPNTDGPAATPDAAGADADAAAGGSDEDAARERRTTNHGGNPDPDDMTMAFTYEAVNRLADPAFAVADARGWCDWIGIVGKVSTPAIRKFQRDNGVDLDFFGGNESGPAERLKDVTEDSMFYADRMAVVGTSGDEWIAEEAGWEFVPLADAADGADWEIEYAE
ncbi:hypothetical protein JCM17823_20480 [Halorubrum gandharaense]